MDNNYFLVIMLVVHWLSDFLFQTNKMSQQKSKDFSVLLDHVMVYTLTWAIPMAIVFGYANPHLWAVSTIIFCSVTFITHLIIDGITSRITSKLHKNNNMYWFFKTIGIDQVLHYLQLWFTYQLILSYL